MLQKFRLPKEIAIPSDCIYCKIIEFPIQVLLAGHTVTYHKPLQKWWFLFAKWYTFSICGADKVTPKCGKTGSYLNKVEETATVSFMFSTYVHMCMLHAKLLCIKKIHLFLYSETIEGKPKCYKDWD